jgi:hypothetical protein
VQFLGKGADFHERTTKYQSQVFIASSSVDTLEISYIISRPCTGSLNPGQFDDLGLNLIARTGEDKRNSVNVRSTQVAFEILNLCSTPRAYPVGTAVDGLRHLAHAGDRPAEFARNHSLILQTK